MNELTLDGKIYVSSKRAAELTGYAKDYVGQLCREGRVESRLVGRNWYVLKDAIKDRKFETPSSLNEEEIEVATPNIPILKEVPLKHEEVIKYVSDKHEPIVTLDNLAETRNDVDTGDIDDEIVPDVDTVTDLNSSWSAWFSRVEETKEEEVVEAPEEDHPEEKVNLKRIREYNPPTLAPEQRFESQKTISKPQTPPQKAPRRSTSLILKTFLIAISLISVAIGYLGSNWYHASISAPGQLRFFSGTETFSKN